MFKLGQIDRKRKPIERFANTGFLTGIIFLLSMIYFSQFLAESKTKAINIVLVCITFASGVILKFPIKKHNIIGSIGFSTKNIEIITLNSTLNIKTEDIQTIKFNIKGYNGQDYLAIKDLYPVHQGTENFVTIYYKKKKKKVEFFMETKYELREIKKIINFYRDKGLLIEPKRKWF